MTDELITYETAVLAKEKGFNNGCPRLHGMLAEYSGLHTYDNFNQSNGDDQYSAPTQSILQRWLREEHRIHVSSIPEGCNKDLGKENWVYQLYNLPKEDITKKFLDNELGEDGDLFINGEQIQDSDWYLREFDTYELALESGLQTALNMIKVNFKN